MSEILTESFCERCGTRYTFESARPKIRLKGVKVLSRGLKNFVLSDDTTMDEAMAAARSETDREGTAHQLDAFHKTFSFCMSCRQYTCPNCWNDAEARCQSCAPLASPDFAPGASRGVLTLVETTVVAEPATNGANGHYLEPITPGAPAVVEAEPATSEAWPVALEPEWERAAEAEVLAAGAEPPAAESEAPAAQAVTADFVADGVAAAAGAKATSQTAGLLSRFRPGQSLDAELAAFERQRSGAETEIGVPQPDESETQPFLEAPSALEEPLAAVAEPEPEAAVEEPFAAVAEPEPEAAVEEPFAAVAEPEPEAAVAIQVEPGPAALSAADVVEQPTWRITAPDAEPPVVGLPALGEPPVPLHSNGAPEAPAVAHWPTKPEWPAQQASQGLPFLGRPVQPQGGVESLWAASNRELVATPPTPGRSTGIQPCISCGLSLSATARFCRRCGTMQG